MQGIKHVYDHISFLTEQYKLGEEDLYLLACFALFHCSGANTSKVRSVMSKLGNGKFRNITDISKKLRNATLLSVGGYNWRNDTYDYFITPDKLIPVMLYLYNEQSEIVKQLMENSKQLNPSGLQKLFWLYIINDKQVDLGNYEALEIKSHIDCFLPITDEPFFDRLIQSLYMADQFLIIEMTLVKAFSRQQMLNMPQMRSLLNYLMPRSSGDRNQRDRLVCLLDLYDYLAYGNIAKHLSASNKNHRIIAAIHEAYHGNMGVAFDHFKAAVKLNNRSTHSYSSNCSYLYLSIANFFMMLVAYRLSTEESLKKCQTLSKCTDKEYTTSCKALYDILSNTNSLVLRKTLDELSKAGTPMDAIICKLLSLYTGLSFPSTYIATATPKWLVLQHEFSKYMPLKGEELAKATVAFGDKPLLTSIMRKQEWESVLDELMGRNTSTPVAPEEKKHRIAYLLKDMNSRNVIIRQQSILKNGTWGAGKEASMSSFLNGGVEGMSEADHRIARNARGKGYYYSNDLSLTDVLKEWTEDVYIITGHYAPFTPVEVTEEMPYLTMHHTNDGFDILSNVPLDSVDSSLIITHRSAASINFLRLSESQRPYYRRLLSLGHFPEEAAGQLREFLTGLGEKVLADGSSLEINSDLLENGSTLPQVDGVSTLVLQMRPHDKESYAVSLFCRPLDGGKTRCVPGKGNEIIVDTANGKRTRVLRDLVKEREHLGHFLDVLYNQVRDIASLSDNNTATDGSATPTTTLIPVFDLLPIIEYAQQNGDRISCEWPEGAEMKIKTRNSSASWGGAIKKNENGWFEIEGSVELDQDKVISMAQLLDLVSQSRGRFIKLGEGEFLALSDKLRRQLNSLSAIASRSHGKLQMSPFSAALLGRDVLEGELSLEIDEELRAIRRRIEESSKYSPQVPKELNATLRKYQKEGFQWMSRLNKWGAGALLADDMGLGKTIQTITFLLSKASEGPALVIAPASVAPNWKTEFEKFAPSLNITMLNFASDRSEAIESAHAHDVIVTTYGLLLSVKDDIVKKAWTTICLDEAHIVKNRGAKTSAVAMQLKSENRIMLTGTPVQNHLGELWNLFQFVNPGLLGSFEDFSRRFIVPIEQNKDKDTQKELDRLVKPFMLRRTKEKVAKELPEKEEIYEHVDLTEEEQLIYEAMRQKAEALLLAEGSNKVSMNTLAEITRLRQCACDARLIEEKKGKKSKDGSKIVALVEKLSAIVEGDGHALVFSQFTSYLALIKKALDTANIPYLYIDGSIDIKTRQKLVEEFQEGKTPVFLISLKAGGLGLNLTRANYVIHMDPWWNPAIEAQATDRAHRIGQKNSVMVYHLIASGTIEEKIQRLHEHKKELVENILESTDMSHKLTGEQLLEMVRG